MRANLKAKSRAKVGLARYWQVVGSLLGESEGEFEAEGEFEGEFEGEVEGEGWLAATLSALRSEAHSVASWGRRQAPPWVRVKLGS
jgi:hypothetical protein